MPAPASKSNLYKIYNILLRVHAKYKVKKVLKHANLGLFHGKTVSYAYKTISKNPQVVHDIHYGKKDVISNDLLTKKFSNISIQRTLNIGYVGRVSPMKAPKDWVGIVEKIASENGQNKLLLNGLVMGLCLMKYVI